MRSLALISTLLLTSWINQNLIAEAHLSWKYIRLTAGNEWLSDTFTEGRYHNLPSKSYALPNTVPVVITYALVEAEAGRTYYEDIYKALANKPITFTR